MENIEGQVDKIALRKASTNAYHRIKNKPVIKFMAITRFGDNSQRHDIAFLTNDLKFYVFSLRFQLHMHHISYVHHDKIWDIFKNFSITSETEILVQDTIDSFCPLMIYFDILQPYLDFWKSIVPLTKIIKRIYHKHPTYSKRIANGTCEVTVKNVNMFLYRAWDYLKDTDECPWITKAIDDNFKLKSVEEMKHQIRVRMCVYYMLIRRHYVNKNKKCEANKQIV